MQNVVIVQMLSKREEHCLAMARKQQGSRESCGWALGGLAHSRRQTSSP